MKLKNLVDYKDGERNVKVIVDNPNHGTAIILAFDKDVSIPTHSTESSVLIQLLEGKCEFILEGEKNLLEEGDFLLLPPGAKHSLYAPERFKVLVTKINA